jgi:Suppressor of fused protein (SUFU)
VSPELLDGVEAHLVAALGPVDGRAAVTFVGTEQVEVLRFGSGSDPAADERGEPVVRYATLGMSRHPMTDPTEIAPAPGVGPRAELVLSLGEPRDDVFRRLAVLAMAPFVEGLVVRAGASLDLTEPLWDGGSFGAVLVGAAGGLVPDLDGVQFFPLFPMTAAESAWRRVHGSGALEARWLAEGTDLRDPRRLAVSLA